MPAWLLERRKRAESALMTVVVDSNGPGSPPAGWASPSRPWVSMPLSAMSATTAGLMALTGDEPARLHHAHRSLPSLVAVVMATGAKRRRSLRLT